MIHAENERSFEAALRGMAYPLTIERMFNRLQQFRRIATRYDKTRKSFSAFLALAAAKIWLPYFVNGT